MDDIISYNVKTKNNLYTVENISFIIGAMKITCNAAIYFANIGNQCTTKVNSVSGFGYSCSEALIRMLDHIPEVIAEHEKTNMKVVDESFEKNNNDEPRE